MVLSHHKTILRSGPPPVLLSQNLWWWDSGTYTWKYITKYCSKCWNPQLYTGIGCYSYSQYYTTHSFDLPDELESFWHISVVVFSPHTLSIFRSSPMLLSHSHLLYCLSSAKFSILIRLVAIHWKPYSLPCICDSAQWFLERMFCWAVGTWSSCSTKNWGVGISKRKWSYDHSVYLLLYCVLKTLRPKEGK